MLLKSTVNFLIINVNKIRVIYYIIISAKGPNPHFLHPYWALDVGKIS